MAPSPVLSRPFYSLLSLSRCLLSPLECLVLQFRSPAFSCSVHRDAGSQDKYRIKSWGKAAAGLRAVVQVLQSESLTHHWVLKDLMHHSFIRDTVIEQLCCARHRDQKMQGSLQETQNFVGEIAPWGMESGEVSDCLYTLGMVARFSK